jgi:hypothetical protein
VNATAFRQAHLASEERYRYDWVSLVKTRKEGRTVFACNDIPEHTFLFEYIGAPLLETNANKLTKQNNVYLYSTFHPAPGRGCSWTIDGSTDLCVRTHPSNASKLINTVLFAWEADEKINCVSEVEVVPPPPPHGRFQMPERVQVVIKAKRRIRKGEFLCLDYGKDREQILANGKRIGCSSEKADEAARAHASVNTGYALCPFVYDAKRTIRWWQPRAHKEFTPHTEWYLSFTDVLAILENKDAHISKTISVQVMPLLSQRCHARYRAQERPLFTHPTLGPSVLSCVDTRELHRILQRTPALVEHVGANDMCIYLGHLLDKLDSGGDHRIDAHRQDDGGNDNNVVMHTENREEAAEEEEDEEDLIVASSVASSSSAHAHAPPALVPIFASHASIAASFPRQAAAPLSIAALASAASCSKPSAAVIDLSLDSD